MRKLLLLPTMLLGLAVATPARGLPIPTLFSTGFADDGQLLTAGPDPHYTLLRIDYAGPYQGFFPSLPPPVQAPYMTTPLQANVLQFTHPAWVSNSDTSRWVSFEGTFGSSLFNTGLYTYQTSFDLTGLDPASVRIVGVWGSDDPGWAFLNLADPTVLDPANLVIPLGGGFGALPAFQITGDNGLFRPGVNTLTFVVWDAGNSVTGLRFEVQSATADPVRTVAVDIKPKSFPNVVTLAAPGVLPVAILGQADFDAATVDVATVVLAGAGVARKPNGAFQASLQDVNGDGHLDLMLHFVIAALSIPPQGGVLSLTAIAGGVAIQGSDTVQVVP